MVSAAAVAARPAKRPALKNIMIDAWNGSYQLGLGPREKVGERRYKATYLAGQKIQTLYCRVRWPALAPNEPCAHAGTDELGAAKPLSWIYLGDWGRSVEMLAVSDRRREERTSLYERESITASASLPRSPAIGSLKTFLSLSSMCRFFLARLSNHFLAEVRRSR